MTTRVAGPVRLSLRKMVDLKHFAILFVAFILPICANQHEGFSHGRFEPTGSHAASKMALGSHAGHADSIVTKKFRSQHTLLISHKAKAHHLHTQHQIAAKAPALIEHHPHAKAATAAGLANKKVLAKIAVPKEHSTSPLHKAEASPAKTDSAKLMKAAATKQHSTFPLHKDGRAIQAPVKWEGFNPRHASEILEVGSSKSAPESKPCC